MRIPSVLASASVSLVMTASLAFTQAPRTPPAPAKPVQTFPADLVKAGEVSFVRDCAFCHGRDTGGGESGPDLTRSKLVADDAGGNQIGPVVRNGRNNMPRFTVSDQELLGLTAFIHTQKNIAESQTGGRKGVDTKDLATGNIAKERSTSTEPANATPATPPPGTSPA